MRYELRAVNPRTSQERTIAVELSDKQIAAVQASQDWMWHVQQIAWPKLPTGFMFISSAVKPVLNS